MIFTEPSFVLEAYMANPVNYLLKPLTKHCRENEKKVADLGCPKSTPYLSFISDDKETGISNWSEPLKNFIKQMQYGKYVALDCGHYIHYYEPQKILFCRRYHNDKIEVIFNIVTPEWIKIRERPGSKIKLLGFSLISCYPHTMLTSFFKTSHLTHRHSTILIKGGITKTKCLPG